MRRIAALKGIGRGATVYPSSICFGMICSPFRQNRVRQSPRGVCQATRIIHPPT
jgi:hypothetical protein